MPSDTSPAPQSPELKCPVETSIQICVEIRISNNLRLSQKNLNYRDLVRVVEKPKDPCLEEINYCEVMAEDQKDRFIQYLAEQYQEEQLTRKAMELVLEDFMEKQKSLEEQMASLRAQQQDQAVLYRALQARHKELEHELAEEREKRQSGERNVMDLREQLDYAHQERFGDRRQRVRKKDKSGNTALTEVDRQEENDGYDGTDDTLRTDSVDANRPQERPDKPLVERDLSNRPGSYKRMGVIGDPVFHPSDFFMRERKSVNVMMPDLPRTSGYEKGKAWKRKRS